MQKLYIFIIIIYLFEEQYEFLHLNARGTKSNKAVGNMYSRFSLKNDQLKKLFSIKAQNDLI